VFVPSKGISTRSATNDLQHEGTHVLDSVTFFGLLPWFPWWVNTVLFSMVYLLVPFGRGVAELRAYRRDVENGESASKWARTLRGSDYLWALWPFSQATIEKWLSVPSPYGSTMP